MPNKIKPLFWLITSFTIGHSITLFLVALKLVFFDVSLIEFLIPITIAISALYNLFKLKTNKTLWFQYAFTCFFGTIHGIAFAAETFGLEGSNNLLPRIVGFNIGIEIAQLTVVVVILLICYIFVSKLKLTLDNFIKAISFSVLVFAIYLSIINFKNL